ncbi:hypothetical protein Dsin_025786 [Dipteronia sinensis]|uniref:Brix domain-containing protein n=1 Tax=Dipteronia sinensis TaxID=43782 RepID=A0AAE0DXG0_9ROSI|nr:hypothetical protein Dsin_025786 [Dipteronia sinensis]
MFVQMVDYANKDFTSIIVHTNSRAQYALLMIGLPNGPNAHFKLSKLVLRKDIKNHGNPTGHKPKLVLSNFTTRLGQCIGRIPGKASCKFHNQRDFIFFRHHGYIFESKETKGSDSNVKKVKEAKGGEKITQERVMVRLQECGPRFTLKLISLQHGTLDTKGGEFEWVHKPGMDTSRRRFFL